MTSQTSVQLPLWRVWLLAIRPKTMGISIIPMVVGTLLAMPYAQWHLLFFAIATAMSIQIGTHFINDALDFKKGADTATRLGPKRITQSGLLPLKIVYALGLLFFFFSLLFAVPLIIKGGLTIFLTLCVCILCGYLYTGGPYPLAYYGLGDFFAFLFFGPVSVCLMYYIQTGFIDFKPILAGIQIGCLETVIIGINNLRDHEGDAAANKRTLAVRFGVTFARVEITALALCPYILSLIWLFTNHFIAGILTFLALPISLFVIMPIWKLRPSAEFNRFFGLAALHHLCFGVLFSLGLIVK